MARIGILTGGGDCPGLNAVIRGIVVRALMLGHEVIGIRRGWRGLMDGGRVMELGAEDVEEIHMAGGTILGASRFDPFAEAKGKVQVKSNLSKYKIDSMICVGGDETIQAAAKFHKAGVKIVAVPKTLDNHVSLTDYTFGFATASNVACEAIERLQTSAKARERVIIVEVIGANSGWTALYSGIAAGTQSILIPEVEFNIDELAEMIKRRKKAGKNYSIITVAEGAKPDKVTQKRELARFVKSLGDVSMGSGIAYWLAEKIQKRAKVETQSVVLGHIQRGGSPTTFDRVLGMRLGAKAVDLIDAQSFGVMTAAKGTEIVSVLARQSGQGKPRRSRRTLRRNENLF